MAAGVTLRKERLQEFRAFLENALKGSRGARARQQSNT